MFSVLTRLALTHGDLPAAASQVLGLKLAAPCMAESILMCSFIGPGLEHVVSNYF